MRQELEDKVTKSLLLIRHAYRHAKWGGKFLGLSYSGGKDSDVMLELCRMSDPKVEVVSFHFCTTIDPPRTLQHCNDNGVSVIRPEKRFAECILESGFPTMFTRHCCGELKERYFCDYVLIGVRRSESVRRSKRYTCDSDLVSSRGGRAMQYYPLLDWTDDDVEEFVNERGIQCHPLYYDDDGKFHVERRLGCMGCPLMYYKKRIEDFRRYPRMVRFWCRYGKRYLESHPNVKTHEYFSDVFEWFVCNTLYNTMEQWRRKWDADRHGLDAKTYLEEYFGVDLDNL